MKFIYCAAIACLLTAALCSCTDNPAEVPSSHVSNIYISVNSDDSVSAVSSEAESSTEVSSETDSSEETSSAKESSKVTSSAESSKETSSAAAPTEYDGDWKLILVNSEHLLPENFTVETEKIGSRAMDARIVDIVKQMISDAKNDGVDLLLTSSYRTVERQTTLFNEQIQKFVNQGYSRKNAEIEAAKWVAVPRTSEHHTGLALDIVTPTFQMLVFEFDTTDAFKWLDSHCTEYGFVLRYPKDKSDITGIVYEPWHYRYVGTEAAAYMKENNLCLEEYVELMGQGQ